MSSSSTAFARAMTPTLDALIQAVISNTVGGATKDNADTEAIQQELIAALSKKIAECRSVDNVIDCIYFDYHSALREFLLNIASWCDKRETVKASLSRLESALSSGSTPNHVRVKAPEFQLTKEFSELGSTKALEARSNQKVVITIALPVICNQIKSIVNIRHRALNTKIEKKRETAANADVEMADATRPGPSLQSLIDKGLNACLKKLNLAPVGKKTLSGQNSSKAPQPQAKPGPLNQSQPSQPRKPPTKANQKVDNKKKGKGNAPARKDPKGKGKAKA